MIRGTVRDNVVPDSVLGDVQGEGRRREFWVILEEFNKLVDCGGLVDDVVVFVLGGDNLEDAIGHPKILEADESPVGEVHNEAVGSKEIHFNDGFVNSGNLEKPGVSC